MIEVSGGDRHHSHLFKKELIEESELEFVPHLCLLRFAKLPFVNIVYGKIEIPST
jgi:hypothetical protein